MPNFCSRRADKYFRRGARLDWPDGATSRESMRAVCKLPRLPVMIQNLRSCYLIYANNVTPYAYKIQI